MEPLVLLTSSGRIFGETPGSASLGWGELGSVCRFGRFAGVRLVAEIDPAGLQSVFLRAGESNGDPVWCVALRAAFVVCARSDGGWTGSPWSRGEGDRIHVS